jgi:hypothetical protein
LCALEQRINSDVGERVLQWEQEIRSGNVQLRIYRDHYWTVALVLWAVSVFAIACGAATWKVSALNSFWTPVGSAVPLAVGYWWKIRDLHVYDVVPAMVRRE